MIKNFTEAVPFLLAGAAIGAMAVSVFHHHAPQLRAFIARLFIARRRKA